jgi:hypothetical protein
VGGDRGSVEFRGFRLVRADGKAFTIRPLRDGYFKQTVPPGTYTLMRKRRDRPYYKEESVTRIFTFKVPEGSLVNLGTLHIVLQGKPEQSLYRASKPAKGRYTYYYRYERPEGDEALSAPLEWFSVKDPANAAAYSGRLVTVNAEPTDFVDSSRFTLRESVFRILFTNKER